MNAPVQRTGPSISRHTSNQAWGTPRVFLDAVEDRFGKIRTDLAASKENAVCAHYFDEKTNSLLQDWSKLKGVAFLNPPFGNIGPWAKKCASVRDRPGWTLLLVPNSTGSNWYEEHVKDKCFELGLNGRIKFVGAETGYPKDLALFVYGFGVRGKDTWRWDTSRRWRLSPKKSVGRPSP